MDETAECWITEKLGPLEDEGYRIEYYIMVIPNPESDPDNIIPITINRSQFDSLIKAGMGVVKVKM